MTVAAQTILRAPAAYGIYVYMVTADDGGVNLTTGFEGQCEEKGGRHGGEYLLTVSGLSHLDLR